MTLKLLLYVGVVVSILPIILLIVFAIIRCLRERREVVRITAWAADLGWSFEKKRVRLPRSIADHKDGAERSASHRCSGFILLKSPVDVQYWTEIFVQHHHSTTARTAMQRGDPAHYSDDYVTHSYSRVAIVVDMGRSYNRIALQPIETTLRTLIQESARKKFRTLLNASNEQEYVVDKEFDAAYSVSADDTSTICSFVGSRVREMLLASHAVALAGSFQLMMRGNKLTIETRYKNVSLKRYKELAAFAQDFLTALASDILQVEPERITFGTA